MPFIQMMNGLRRKGRCHVKQMLVSQFFNIPLTKNDKPKTGNTEPLSLRQISILHAKRQFGFRPHTQRTGTPAPRY